MKRQYVTQQQLDDLESKAGTIRKSIEEAKIISKGGEEGVKVALKRFRNYRVWIQNKIADNNRRLNVSRMIQNSELAGQEWAMSMVISTFEGAKNDMLMFGDQLQRLEKQLNEWKKLAVRNDSTDDE